MADLKARPTWRGTGNTDNANNFEQVNLGLKSHAGAMLGGGTSADPVTTATADTKWMSFYLENSATSGDGRGLYLRFYLSGAGGGGEAARIFTTVNDVAAATVHGAHISLSFADTGTVTGQGIAMRATLHLPSVALTSNVTMAAVQAEIYSDGTASDPGGSTILSFLRCVNGGHANGIADVDDDAFLIHYTGGAISSGNVVQTEADETKFSHKIRVNMSGTTMYLMACDS